MPARRPGPRLAIEVTESAVRARTVAGVHAAPHGDVAAAVAALDDDMALLPDRVVPSRVLWAALLESVAVDDAAPHAPVRPASAVAPVHIDSMALVHPTTWGPTRLALLSNAARMVAAAVTLRSRSVVLADRAVRADVSGRSFVLIEVHPDEVAVIVAGAGSGGEAVSVVQHLEPRNWERTVPGDVADAVAVVVGEIVHGDRPGVAAIFVDDAQDSLGPMIVAAVERLGLTPPVSQTALDAVFRVADSSGPTTTAVADAPAAGHDEGRVRSDESTVFGGREGWSTAAPVRRERRDVLPWWPAAAAIVLVAVVAIGLLVALLPRTAGRTGQARPQPAMATSLLVEGRVQLMVPASWAVRRIPAGGAGSARVEVLSPDDREVMVHVTQVRVPSGETLATTADTLRAAMDKEPEGVFTDFKADDRRMGRPAVTYTEVRAGHDIAWTVIRDAQLRIGVGCQFPKNSYESVREACELAVKTANEVKSVS